MFDIKKNLTEATNRHNITLKIGDEVRCTKDCLIRGIGFSEIREVVRMTDVGGDIIVRVYEDVNILFDEIQIDWLEK